MNVSEYANDVGKKVSEILKLCQTLDIKVSNEEDMLSDDDIIMLDNEIANMDEEEEVEELEEEIEDFADSYEEELEEITSNDKEEVHKKKISKRMILGLKEKKCTNIKKNYNQILILIVMM